MSILQTVNSVAIAGLLSTTETIYGFCFCLIITFVVTYRVITQLISIILKSSIMSSFIRPFFMRHFLYPSHRGYLLGIWSSSRLDLILVVLYFVLTSVCTAINVDSVDKATIRTGRLALINLLPLFLGGGYQFGASLLGISLQGYGVFHRAIGSVVFLEALAHVILVVQKDSTDLAQERQFYGLLVGSAHRNRTTSKLTLSDWMYATVSDIPAHSQEKGL